MYDRPPTRAPKKLSRTVRRSKNVKKPARKTWMMKPHVIAASVGMTKRSSAVG
jgi:hypothetical protein